MTEDRQEKLPPGAKRIAHLALELTRKYGHKLVLEDDPSLRRWICMTCQRTLRHILEGDEKNRHCVGGLPEDVEDLHDLISQERQLHQQTIDKLEAVRKLLDDNKMAVKFEDGSTVHTYTDVDWQQLADILNSTEDQT